ncbi:hypothetical protein EIP91_009786 [Steccherinum ochraceum]|uniref:DUF6535 domain-containing protein n=1 Tax=Steccherinum ochraceum TaxID=92696 RepID=A0A4R0RNU8_9APHY|nr:hypothetical protein EIP91_009786 [Steccherinum ochraceum]
MDSSSAGKDAAKMSRDEVLAVVKDILATLEKSSIVPQGVPDKILRFWTRYKEEATEYDTEFLHKYREDMDTSMIFAGLFSAVTATVASMTIPDLSPNPADTTNALLQNIWMSVNHTSGAAPSTAPLPTWNGPPASVIWVQCLLYTSLACSLFAALGAVLGKQWLNRYNSVDEHGSLEERCRTRHRKFTAMEEWHFRRVLEALPVLLQLSLLLFGLALSAFMFTRQLAIAIVLTFANLIGAGFYFTVVTQSVRFDSSPFQTPLSDLLRRTPTYAARSRKAVFQYWQGSSARKHALEWGSKIGSSSARCARAVMETLSRTVRPLGTSILFAARLVRRMRSAITALVRGSRTATGDTTVVDRDAEQAVALAHRSPPAIADHTSPQSASHPDSFFRTVRETFRNGSTSLTRLLPTKGPGGTHIVPRVSATSGSDPARETALAVLWLLDATTDPVVRTDILLAVHLMEWPMDLRKKLCTGDRLDFLLQQVVACFRFKTADNSAWLPTTHERRASELCAAFLFLYWELRILDQQASREWCSGSGGLFAVEYQLTIVRAMCAYKNGKPHGDAAVVFYLVYLTFTVDQSFSRQSDSTLYVPKRCSSTTTNTEFLCTRTLLYLAYVSALEGLPAKQSDVLKGIAHHLSRETSHETVAVSLIATAVLCCKGHGARLYQNSDVFDRDHALTYASALLDAISAELEHFILPGLQPRWHENMDHIVSVLERGVGTLHVLRTAEVSFRLFDVCRNGFSVWRHRYDIASVIHIFPRLLELAVSIPSIAETFNLESKFIPNVMWRPPSPFDWHAAWLLDFLGHLHRHSTQSDQELTRRGTLSALLVLAKTRLTDLLKDDKLMAALTWVNASTTPAIPPERDDHATEQHEYTRVSLQAVAMALLHSLIKIVTDSSPRLIIASQKIRLMNNLVVHPETLQTQLFPSQQNPLHDCIVQRDALFLKIVWRLSYVDRDIWLNDMENDPFVRSWVHIAGRYSLANPELRSLESYLPFDHITPLLACNRVRRPTEKVWGDQVVRVAKVGMMATWRFWRSYWDVLEHPREHHSLIAHAADFISALDPRHAPDVDLGWYLEEIQSQIKATQERKPDLSPSLQPAMDAVVKKRMEIKQLASQ